MARSGDFLHGRVPHAAQREKFLLSRPAVIDVRKRCIMSESFVLKGNIWTGDSGKPYVEALRVSGGKVLQTGSVSEIVPSAGEKVYDYGRCLVTPGFTDAHLHFGAYARAGIYPDCGSAESLEDLLDFLRGQVKDAGAGRWVRCINFIELNWKHPAVPTRLQLDRIAPDTPLVVSHYGAHMHIANTAAFKSAGLWDSSDPEIERGSDGLPTGKLFDSGADAMIRAIQAQHETDAALTAFFEKALHKLTSLGLTALHACDAPTYALGERPDLMQNLDAGGRMPMHVFFYHDRLPDFKVRSQRNFKSGHLAYAGLKVFADGSLGARTAALSRPYSDEPGESGHLIHTDEQMISLFRAAQMRGIQVQTHAIGDAACKQVVRCVEAVQKELGRPEAPYRLNHAIVLGEGMPERIARAGIVVDLQPIQIWDDRNMAPLRLGPRLFRMAYQLRRLADAGILLTGSSDAPCDDPNPWYGIGVAATHLGLDGSVPEGHDTAQKLTLDEALRLYTVNPWKAMAFDGPAAGTLVPGAPADIAVADRDVFKAAPAEICQVKNQATFFEGEKVF